jgi:hypothetical protein
MPWIQGFVVSRCGQDGRVQDALIERYLTNGIGRYQTLSNYDGHHLAGRH